MSFERVWSGVGPAIVALGLAVGAEGQQCNLQNPPCPATCNPGGGCAAPIAIQHATNSPCVGGGGGFDLRGTEFENACADPFGGGGCFDACATRVAVPPLRFWQYDTYATANSGCQDPLANGWLFNGLGDFGIGSECGHWALFQANWLGPRLQGCIAAANGPLRTVAEISFPDASLEGTIHHRSWYAIGAVDVDADGYNFDRVTGGTAPACNPAEMVVAPVSAVSVADRTLPCAGSAIATPVVIDASFNAVLQLHLTDPNPGWYTESGRDGAPGLIAGYQVVYADGAEPTSSDYFTGGWRPALDPVNAANAAGVFLLPISNPITVAVPAVSGRSYWLAARIIYRDASLNPTGSFPIANAGPLIASDVGPHCGPVTPFLTAVEYATLHVERSARGAHLRWQTVSEDDTSFFRVFRAGNAAGTEAVVEVAPYVEAHGAFLDYDVIDASVLDDPARTWYYWVVEMTSAGAGTRSPVVELMGIGGADGRRSSGAASGARRRGASR